MTNLDKTQIEMGALQNKDKKWQVYGKDFAKILNLKQHLLTHGTKKVEKIKQKVAVKTETKPCNSNFLPRQENGNAK